MRLTNQQKNAWVLDQLDQEEERIHSRFTGRANKNDEAIYAQLFDPVEEAIRSAWRGDIEPLKKLYPKLAPFLVARKRLQDRGPRIDSVTLVVNDVKCVRTYGRRMIGLASRSRTHCCSIC
jgi:hypothetical protein